MKKTESYVEIFSYVLVLRYKFNLYFHKVTPRLSKVPKAQTLDALT